MVIIRDVINDAYSTLVQVGFGPWFSKSGAGPLVGNRDMSSGVRRTKEF